MKHRHTPQPAFTPQQVQEVRAELLGGPTSALAIAASCIAWVVSPETALALWRGADLTTYQHSAVSHAINQLVTSGWQFNCLTPAAPIGPAFTAPRLRVA